MFITKKELEEKKQIIKGKYKKKLFGQRKVTKEIKELEKKAIENNKKFISYELKKYKKLFDNIRGNSLDKSQRKIIVTDENETLVVAGAGSGKSLTIVGKVSYLLKKGIKKEEILCLSFTNEACDSLSKKLNGVRVLTFHKLGVEILKSHGFNVTLVSENVLFDIVKETVYSNDLFMKIIPDFDFVTLGEDDLTYLQRIIMLNSTYVKRLIMDIVTFINLFKGNNYEINDFDKFLIKNKKESNRYIREKNSAFLNLSKMIYESYTYYLEKNKLIDFNDMINKAIKVIDKFGFDGYKYIIVDEYQDTSLVKCLFIQSIVKKSNSKLLAVGDDFQSIYRFTGSNLDVFINFNKYFNGTIHYLNRTYRNSQELITTMGNFIMKNRRQIKKELVSDISCFYPILIYFYEDDISEIVDKILFEFENITFLGRNNRSLDSISVPNKMTVHASKGLEFENVAIIDLENKVNGFPNKMVNEDVFKYVLSGEDYFPYEEERRLFYVAMTRTKNKVCLCVKKSNPSVFVLEILKDIKNVKIVSNPIFCKCGGVYKNQISDKELYLVCNKCSKEKRQK